MKRSVRLFDPLGVKPEEYRSLYPELKRIREFENLQTKALIFVWWYANPTSYIADIDNDYERASKALEASKYSPTKAVKDNILQLRFTDDLAAAIDRMARFREDIRVRVKEMMENILKTYESMANKTEDSEGFDIDKYVTVTTKIIDKLPELIEKVEEGFGITYRSMDEELESVQSFLKDWHTSKE